MAEDRFPRRVVERSFRKFNDIVNDLTYAQFQTWGDTFSHLITHCRTDPVMQIVTAPLAANKRVNAEKWYNEARESVGGMVGSGSYSLPYDDEDRTALLYQFFLMLENGKVDLISFCVDMYGTTRFQDAVQTFNAELVQKFTREVSYRLNEIIADIGEEQSVPREAMVVFHHHDYSTNVHGNIQGSNVATGGSSISESTATYSTAEDLAGALKALHPLVGEVAARDRIQVGAAVQVLIDAAHDKSIGAERVAEATRVIADKSPSMGQRLRELAGKVGISLVSSAIVQGIKSGLGL